MIGLSVPAVVTFGARVDIILGVRVVIIFGACNDGSFGAHINNILGARNDRSFGAGRIMTFGARVASHRRYIYISILAIDPTYFINAYGQNPTS